MNFIYNLPVNIVFGRGKVLETGAITSKYGTCALLVTGGQSTKKSGLLEKVTLSLENAGIKTILFDKVTANPLTTCAYEGADIALENKCDVVVGIGGGSSLDAAKAIAFQTVNGGDISEYIFGLKTSEKALPVILIPTTCGTGSEGNGFAVLTNPDTMDKKSLRCNAIIAKCSIVDPEVMKTMPKNILASVGFDALCHNMEAFISKNASPFTDMYAKLAIGLLGKNLVKVYLHPENEDAWDAVTFASTLGGMVIHSAGVCAPHGMEHPVSGLRNVVHGNGLAALTPIIIEESIDAAPEKFGEISKLLGGNNEKDLAVTIRKMLSDLELTIGLKDLGVVDEDIDWMAENCMKVSAPSLKTHPKQFELNDLKRIYKKAL